MYYQSLHNALFIHFYTYTHCRAVNAGKSLRNEDQARIHVGFLERRSSENGQATGESEFHTPPSTPEKDGSPSNRPPSRRQRIPYVYFAMFDGHAGTGAAISASYELHCILHVWRLYCVLCGILHHLLMYAFRTNSWMCFTICCPLMKLVSRHPLLVAIKPCGFQNERLALRVSWWEHWNRRSIRWYWRFPSKLFMCIISDFFFLCRETPFYRTIWLPKTGLSIELLVGAPWWWLSSFAVSCSWRTLGTRVLFYAVVERHSPCPMTLHRRRNVSESAN